MNTSVNIGSSQEFRLKRALLLYGESCYDGFPYRHPFLVTHEVVHEGEGARLGPGHLVTPNMLADLAAALGQSPPMEVLPECVLVRNKEMIVWWSPARVRRMFFSDRSGDGVLKKMNGKLYPHPALLFKACGSRLWVRALNIDKRPNAETALYDAPYWNCYDDGTVCTGSMAIPREETIAAIPMWEEAFFRSEFTHAGGVRRHTRHRDGMLAMWRELAGKRTFPSRYLVPARRTLGDLVKGDGK